jgi:hypothetical protein
MGTLASLRGRVILDEVQLLPQLFPLLRVLADRPEMPARFLLLGSASPRLVRQASETLAGRLFHIEMAGFTGGEVWQWRIPPLSRRSLPGRSSADFQSAVSPNCIRQAPGLAQVLGYAGRVQIINLRYGRLRICVTHLVSSIGLRRAHVGMQWSFVLDRTVRLA